MRLRSDEFSESMACGLRRPSARDSTSARRSGSTRRSRSLDALGNATGLSARQVLDVRRAGIAASRGLRQLAEVLDLYDAGAAVAEGNLVAALADSSGLPAAPDPDSGVERRRPSAVLPRHGLGGIDVAVEYDGDQHRTTASSTRTTYSARRHRSTRLDALSGRQDEHRSGCLVSTSTAFGVENAGADREIS